MMISELIERLQKIKDEVGDHAIYCTSEDGKTSQHFLKDVLVQHVNAFNMDNGKEEDLVFVTIR